AGGADFQTVARESSAKREDKVFLDSLAKIYTTGQDIKWQSLFDKQFNQRLHLPSYPFQRKICWSDAIKLPEHQQGFLQEASDWLYKTKWETIQIEPKTSNEKEQWLIFTDELGVGTDLTRELQAQGLQVVSHNIKDLNGSNDTPDITQYQQLLSSIDNETPLNIIYLSGLDLNEASPIQGKGITKEYSHFCKTTDFITESILYLAQAMQQRKNCSLWLITDKAISTDNKESTLNSPQFIISGFAKTLKLEMAGAFKSHIDIAATDNASNQVLLSILQSSTTESTIAVRDNTPSAPRLVRANSLVEEATEKDAVKELLINQNASYLIIGGLGSIGFSAAEHLIKLGAQKLALMSRGGIKSVQNNNIASKINAHLANGIDIQCPQVDITNEKQVSALLEKLNRSDKPVKGIIHAAGAFDITAIKDLTPASCYKVMDSKVKGAWLLDRLVDLHCDNLDFFVGFSSIASVWGSAGNFHYAGANAYIDGMMQKRYQQQKTAMSINWGPWSDTNMLTDDSSSMAAKRGLSMLTHSQGLRLFEWALCHPRINQLVIAKVSWPELGPLLALTGGDHLIKELVASSSIPSTVELGPRANASSGGLQELEPLSKADIEFQNNLPNWTKQEREKQLLSYLRQQLTRALQIDDSDFDSTSPLINVGIDSLIAVEFKNRIRLLTDIDVPMVKLLEGANLMDIAELLSDHYELSNASISNASIEKLVPDEDPKPNLIEGAL
ncbi:MAG: SDR family NAD(P)-dependent oxidoreductase, partial [Pseudomonadales bacterium]|nr:SDR family NAD(P)-dependent oxidoreductase [Pseudomonadales bacterium]